jgi:hypothetical protein
MRPSPSLPLPSSDIKTVNIKEDSSMSLFSSISQTTQTTQANQANQANQSQSDPFTESVIASDHHFNTANATATANLLANTSPSIGNHNMAMIPLDVKSNSVSFYIPTTESAAIEEMSPKGTPTSTLTSKPTPTSIPTAAPTTTTASTISTTSTHSNYSLEQTDCKSGNDHIDLTKSIPSSVSSPSSCLKVDPTNFPDHQQSKPPSSSKPSSSSISHDQSNTINKSLIIPCFTNRFWLNNKSALLINTNHLHLLPKLIRQQRQHSNHHSMSKCTNSNNNDSSISSTTHQLIKKKLILASTRRNLILAERKERLRLHWHRVRSIRRAYRRSLRERFIVELGLQEEHQKGSLTVQQSEGQMLFSGHGREDVDEEGEEEEEEGGKTLVVTSPISAHLTTEIDSKMGSCEEEEYEAEERVVSGPSSPSFISSSDDEDDNDYDDNDDDDEKSVVMVEVREEDGSKVRKLKSFFLDCERRRSGGSGSMLKSKKESETKSNKKGLTTCRGVDDETGGSVHHHHHGYGRRSGKKEKIQSASRVSLGGRGDDRYEENSGSISPESAAFFSRFEAMEVSMSSPQDENPSPSSSLVVPSKHIKATPKLQIPASLSYHHHQQHLHQNHQHLHHIPYHQHQSQSIYSSSSSSSSTTSSSPSLSSKSLSSSMVVDTSTIASPSPRSSPTPSDPYPYPYPKASTTSSSLEHQPLTLAAAIVEEESMAAQAQRTKRLDVELLESVDEDTYFVEFAHLLPPVTRFTLRELDMDEVHFSLFSAIFLSMYSDECLSLVLSLITLSHIHLILF